MCYRTRGLRSQACSPYLNVVSRTIAGVALVHLSSLSSRFSIMYPVIGEPPSFLGLDQVIVMESSDVSTPFGIPGAPGTSKTISTTRFSIRKNNPYADVIYEIYFRHTKRMSRSDRIDGNSGIRYSILIFSHNAELVCFSNDEIARFTLL